MVLLGPSAPAQASARRLRCMKRHVFICLGCDRLAYSTRSDAITCSTACRVRVHRTGEAKALRKALDGSLSRERQLEAVRLLRPDLADRIMAGKIKLDAVQDEIARIFASRHSRQ